MKHMPRYCEEMRQVEMGPLLGPAYRAFERNITQQVKDALANDGSAPLLPWLKALLMYADLPYLGWTCRTRSGTVLGSAPALPFNMVYPIEQALIDYVGEQIWGAHLPTIVLTENTGIFDDQGRLEALIAQHARGPTNEMPRVAGLYQAMLRRERQNGIEACAREGVQVLICNPSLLLGLDLSYFKRAAFKRVPTQIETLLHFTPCLLNPTQDTDVEVVFFAYQESLALRLLHHQARRAFGRGRFAERSHVGASQSQHDEPLLEMARTLFETMKNEPQTHEMGC